MIAVVGILHLLMLTSSVWGRYTKTEFYQEFDQIYSFCWSPNIWLSREKCSRCCVTWLGLKLYDLLVLIVLRNLWGLGQFNYCLRSIRDLVKFTSMGLYYRSAQLTSVETLKAVCWQREPKLWPWEICLGEYFAMARLPLLVVSGCCKRTHEVSACCHNKIQSLLKSRILGPTSKKKKREFYISVWGRGTEIFD